MTLVSKKTNDEKTFTLRPFVYGDESSVIECVIEEYGYTYYRREYYDEELLKSAGLYTEDRVTGEKGFNLAAVMLLGKDEVIRDVAPTYSTDALLRKVNVDRYDDRLIVETNLIESYDRLFEFATKHLLDKFYLDAQRIFKRLSGKIHYRKRLNVCGKCKPRKKRRNNHS